MDQYNFPIERLVDGEVSREALSTTFALKSAVNRSVGNGSLPEFIPNSDGLRVGDVILTRPKRNPKTKPSIIEQVQLKQNFEAACAMWTHVALYVGDLHVLEAQAFKDKSAPRKRLFGRNVISPGVQVEPLTKYMADYEFVVLRHTNKLYDKVRMNVARHGLLDLAVHKRSYGLRRAFKAVNFEGFSEKDRPRLDKEVICSELVLECLAIGAQVLVKEFDALNQGERYFFPADFASSPDFVEQTVSLLKVT